MVSAKGGDVNVSTPGANGHSNLFRSSIRRWHLKKSCKSLFCALTYIGILISIVLV